MFNHVNVIKCFAMYICVGMLIGHGLSQAKSMLQGILLAVAKVGGGLRGYTMLHHVTDYDLYGNGNFACLCIFQR